jgi:hypothetical protein
MRETINSWISHKIFKNTARTFILNAEDKRIQKQEDERLAEETRQRLINLELERKKNPIKCDVCSERESKDVFFEGLSWYQFVVNMDLHQFIMTDVLHVLI